MGCTAGSLALKPGTVAVHNASADCSKCIYKWLDMHYVAINVFTKLLGMHMEILRLSDSNLSKTGYLLT